LVLKRGGTVTDVKFEVHPPAVIGRFDPSVGPVDVDLGNIDEGVYVSRKHARISFEDGVWKISDLGSSNGTYVLRSDFEKVDEAELTNGSEFALGNARFVFMLASPEAGASEPAVDAPPEPEEPEELAAPEQPEEPSGPA
jgi:pSer/pThr/pTyr-binding forkhead associated (FHA) protein